MKVITQPSELPVRRVPCVATIGTFDGFHRGHWHIVRRTIAGARRLRAKSLLITFDEHPRLVLSKNFPGYITERGKKVSLLKDSGLDYIWYIPFTPAVSRKSGEEFIRYIERYFDLRMIVVGEGFRFGSMAESTVDDLEAIGSELGFSVKSLPRLHSGRIEISSSAIRQAIRGGDLGLVCRLMGRPYSIVSTVVHGQGFGSSVLHVPTANIDATNKVLPPAGVYVTCVACGGKVYPAVTNLGFAPTMRSQGHRIVESFLLDFKGDLYGKIIEVFFLKFLRREEEFESHEALRSQIGHDITKARRYFQTRKSCARLIVSHI
jgi:riboflavin kinase/FMN adenylyltransferase